MRWAGEEAGVRLLHASGVRRFLTLSALMLGTWIAVIVITSGMGSASAELGEMIHLPNGQPRPTSPIGHAVQFVANWKEGIRGALHAHIRFSSSSRELVVLVWLATSATLFSALALLAPLVGAARRDGSGMPLTLAIMGGSVLGGGLGVGVMLVLIDIPRIMARLRGGSEPFANTSPWMFLLLGLLVWIFTGGIWGLALRSAGSASVPGRIARHVRWLFAGTVVELALAAPTFATAARRDSCYCAWGSWFALLIGAAVLTVLCGPMLILLWTREARIKWIRGACGNCGYPMRTGCLICPECGAVKNHWASIRADRM